MIELAGQEKKIEAFIDVLRPYGIKELARAGRIALVRSGQPDRDRVDVPETDAGQVVGHSSL